MDDRLGSSLASAILAMPGVEEHPSRFNSARSAFWVGRREFAHVERGHIDLRLTRKQISARRAALKVDDRVALRGGDWLEIAVRTVRDLRFVIDLVRAALQANR